MSADGRYAVVNETLEQQGNFVWRARVWLVRTRDGAVVERIDDDLAPGFTRAFGIDRTGRYLALETCDRTFDYPDDTVNFCAWDAYRRDLVARTDVGVTQNAAGVAANFLTIPEAMTPDARTIIFSSQANNLLPGDHPLYPRDGHWENDDLFAATLPVSP